MLLRCSVIYSINNLIINYKSRRIYTVWFQCKNFQWYFQQWLCQPPHIAEVNYSIWFQKMPPSRTLFFSIVAFEFFLPQLAICVSIWRSEGETHTHRENQPNWTMFYVDALYIILTFLTHFIINVHFNTLNWIDSVEKRKNIQFILLAPEFLKL